MDFRGDRRLDVNLQVHPPNRVGRELKQFPFEILPQQHSDGSIRYELNKAVLTVCADLEQNLKGQNGDLAILYASGKPGFHCQFGKPLKYEKIKFYVSLLVVLNGPFPPSAGVTWEHDLLPFLPGGQLESSRRKH